MRIQPDAGLDPVALHPTHSGVGARYVYQIQLPQCGTTEKDEVDV